MLFEVLNLLLILFYQFCFTFELLFVGFITTSYKDSKTYASF